MNNTEYSFNKYKQKNFPVLSLSKIKNQNGKKYSNRSLNSVTCSEVNSEFNSKSYSSKQQKYSKNSYTNSDKSVKPYKAYISSANQINRTQESTEAKIKKQLIENIPNMKQQFNELEKKRLSKVYDKNYLLLNEINDKKPENGNKIRIINTFNTPTRKDLKIKGLYSNKKKVLPIKKNNVTILKKFEGDFHKFYLNSLKNTKNEFLQKIEKINKTFYKSYFRTSETFKNTKEKKNESESKKNTFYMELNPESNYDEESFYRLHEPLSGSKDKDTLANKIIKTKYSSQFLRLNKYHKRKRNFRLYMDEKNIFEKKWKTKLEMNETKIKYNPLLLNDIHFQSNIIKDELCLLLEDIQHFRLTFFDDPDLYSAFKNKDISYQIKLNKMIEETCALLHLIPKIILKEYYNYTDKFISISDPSREFFAKKIVYNEAECFQDNIKNLYRILNFVKCCNEVYSQLIAQVEDEMIITLQNFHLIKRLLEKLRLYMINLTNICKNILKDYIFDKHIIEKFKTAMKKTNKTKIRNQRDNKPKTNEKNDDNNYDYSEYNDDYKNTLYFFDENRKDSNNEEEKEHNDDESINRKMSKYYKNDNNFLNQKLTRITKALESNNSLNEKETKKGHDSFKAKQAKIAMGGSGPMALINSRLMTKMLKYIKKEYKQKIISIRTSEKFLGDNK